MIRSARFALRRERVGVLLVQATLVVSGAEVPEGVVHREPCPDAGRGADHHTAAPGGREPGARCRLHGHPGCPRPASVLADGDGRLPHNAARGRRRSAARGGGDGHRPGPAGQDEVGAGPRQRQVAFDAGSVAHRIRRRTGPGRAARPGRGRCRTRRASPTRAPRPATSHPRRAAHTRLESRPYLPLGSRGHLNTAPHRTTWATASTEDSREPIYNTYSRPSP